MFMLDHNKHV